MNWESLLLNANATVCLLIAVRLMFFQRNGRRHRRIMAWLAYVVILAAAYIPFRIWFGQYSHVDPAELLINSMVCLAVWSANGNIAQAFIRSWS
ncbi:phage holin family protein [Buttiauxella noackiae]|uniref:phage holin family protein n=1 Tax=Buttiauxella noackiae TaxID=82992 RepID=UPI0035A646CA